MKIDKQNLKEQLFVIGTLTGAFLSIRMFIFIFVTQQWYFTVGVVATFGYTIFILSRYDKLGIFGKLFMKQLKSLTTKPRANIYYAYFLIAVGASIVTLFWIDEGNGPLLEQRQLFLAIDMIHNPHLQDNLLTAHVPVPNQNVIATANKMNQDQQNTYVLNHVKDGNFIMALLLSLENYEWNGWLSNFAEVTLAGEVEGLALFFYYRKIAQNIKA